MRTSVRLEQNSSYSFSQIQLKIVTVQHITESHLVYAQQSCTDTFTIKFPLRTKPLYTFLSLYILTVLNQHFSYLPEFRTLLLVIFFCHMYSRTYNTCFQISYQTALCQILVLIPYPWIFSKRKQHTCLVVMNNYVTIPWALQLHYLKIQGNENPGLFLAATSCNWIQSFILKKFQLSWKALEYILCKNVSACDLPITLGINFQSLPPKRYLLQTVFSCVTNTIIKVNGLENKMIEDLLQLLSKRYLFIYVSVEYQHNYGFT